MSSSRPGCARLSAEESELTVGAGVELPATLTLPEGSGPHAAIVPLHPASERGRDQMLFAHLAEVLPRAGIAVLRYDRRGDDVPLDDQVADALSAVAALQRRSDIDRTRIGLWGFSQGAWVAPRAASVTRDVAFLVLVAATGVSPAAQMRYGTARHVREAGYSADVVARLMVLRTAFEDYARGQIERSTAQGVVDSVKDEPWFEHAYVRADLPSAPGFWPDMDFDPVSYFRDVRVPTLLFYGEDDEWQPIDESITAWRRAADLAGNPEVTIVRLPGTRHAPTTGDVDERRAISPEYEDELLGWLSEGGFARMGD